LGGHFGPFADAADVTGISQSNGGETGHLALLDPDFDGLRRHGLTEAVLPVDDRKDWRFANDLDLPVGHEVAVGLPLQVPWNTDDAVTVMSGQVRADERFAEALALGLRAPSLDEDVAHKLAQLVSPDRDHAVSSDPLHSPRA
jgi:hypothetical protein